MLGRMSAKDCLTEPMLRGWLQEQQSAILLAGGDKDCKSSVDVELASCGELDGASLLHGCNIAVVCLPPEQAQQAGSVARVAGKAPASDAGEHLHGGVETINMGPRASLCHLKQGWSGCSRRLPAPEPRWLSMPLGTCVCWRQSMVAA